MSLACILTCDFQDVDLSYDEQLDDEVLITRGETVDGEAYNGATGRLRDEWICWYVKLTYMHRIPMILVMMHLTSISDRSKFNPTSCVGTYRYPVNDEIQRSHSTQLYISRSRPRTEIDRITCKN